MLYFLNTGTKLSLNHLCVDTVETEAAVTQNKKKKNCLWNHSEITEVTVKTYNRGFEPTPPPPPPPKKKKSNGRGGGGRERDRQTDRQRERERYFCVLRGR